jgi:hypothetical protein
MRYTYGSEIRMFIIVGYKLIKNKQCHEYKYLYVQINANSKQDEHKLRNCTTKTGALNSWWQSIHYKKRHYTKSTVMKSINFYGCEIQILHKKTNNNANKKSQLWAIFWANSIHPHPISFRSMLMLPSPLPSSKCMHFNMLCASSFSPQPSYMSSLLYPLRF